MVRCVMYLTPCFPGYPWIKTSESPHVVSFRLSALSFDADELHHAEERTQRNHEYKRHSSFNICPHHAEYQADEANTKG